ncbi:uncharacterized protein LOC127875469 isoform X2 [Dreissena polymorpha]|uniref:GPR180/TMEM145 transmembrane domain-containing protein n=1 Tax=Dreissena polymorpha TaxID=45954 RepID=A0A9D4L9W9_DREPO|nr:uncharacterized protein LOC127875469 isoform X2 [Dreissena polymorpha]KAH3854170.1 hypothetical protein DPMN_096709 [Dreissena polymorpha]
MKFEIVSMSFGIVFLQLLQTTRCLHLTGTWKTSEFYRFLTKFGFQKTDPGKLDDTQGFVYGNVTAKDSKLNNKFTLVLVDSDYFLEFYGNQSVHGADTCSKMFRKIDTMAFDYPCHTDKTEDFLRKIPCPSGQLCIDEDNPKNVLPGYQFTYRIQNSVQPRFWYVSLVACHRTSQSCSWQERTDLDFEVEYDIWLVNGDPASKHLNPFEHQFSFEMHDVFEIYAIFCLLYIPTIVVWLMAFYKQLHTITKMFTVCICGEFAGISFNFLHVLIFAFNGVGAEWLKVLGNLLGILAECLFMLLLLVIAKGWTVTSLTLSSKLHVIGIWTVYTVLNTVFFIVSLTKVDLITNVDEWNSWPGYVIVAFRLVVMIWFFFELRATMRHDFPMTLLARLDFYHQFAAYYLVWFIYLPVLVLIANQFSYLWRYKTILSITYGADWLSFLVLIHLFWPSRSVLYLIKGEQPLSQYDLEAIGLDEFDNEDTVYESRRFSSKQESYRMKKQETTLPVIQEANPVNGVTERNKKAVETTDGSVKKRTKIDSKTKLLDINDSSPKIHKNKDYYKENGTAYTNVNLSGSDED